MPFRTEEARHGFEQRALVMHVPNWIRSWGGGDDILFCFNIRNKWRKKKEKEMKNVWLTIDLQRISKATTSGQLYSKFSC